MANLPRKDIKIFGNTAAAADIRQFGSTREGNVVNSTDPNVLQDLANYEKAWKEGVVGSLNIPPLEEFNTLQFLATRELAYLQQVGFPEFSLTTTYYANKSITRQIDGTKLYKSVIDDNLGLDIDAADYNAGTTYEIDDVAADTNGDIYRSLTADNQGNPLTDVVNWELVWQFLGDLANLTNLEEATQQLKGASLLPNRITVASNSTDEDHDVDFSAGNFIFDDGSGQAVALALTKRIDATFTEGDNQGGLDTGTVANNTFYHLFAIRNLTTETSDYLFSLSKTSPTLPTGYTKQKRIGTVRTDGSANIRPFDQQGNEFIYRTYIVDRAESAAPTSPTNLTLTTPPNTVAINNLFYAESGGTTAAQILFCATNNDNLNASTTNFTMRNATPGGSQQSYSQSDVRTKVNSSSQVNIDANSAETFQVLTVGYVDWELDL